ncbi:MAG: thermonuclease family protein [Clostridia bacterium]|nr:thermonuclease family protein [Clostridia bacterium]
MKLTKKQKKQIVKYGLAIIIITIGLITGSIKKEEILNIFQNETTVQTEQTKEIEGKYLILEVVDGDTYKIQYNGKEEKVRLIGVDTPESVHQDKSKNTEYGKQASNYVKELIENKYVSLEFDVSQTDKYGRLLAYVYLEDGEMLNEKLLKEGYAKTATYAPNVKYVDQFKVLQEEARNNKVGFWKEDVF